MPRETTALEQGEFDVLVVGAGINGAAVAWDAALRGMKVALIDKGDFGAATSAGCFKIVHGGLRYLQHFDLSRLYKSVEEQRVLRIIAPHLVKPLPFLVPCYRRLMQRRATLHLGVSLYEILTMRRNRGVSGANRLPRHRVLSQKECLQIAPGINSEGLSGGVVFYDSQMSNCERLTFSVVQSAAAAGAQVFNYMQLRECVLGETGSGGNHFLIRSVKLRDVLTGKKLIVRAKYIVNATGPWVEYFAQTFNTSRSLKLPRVVYSKGLQIVVPQLIKDCAVAVEGRDGDPAAKVARGARSYFIQPWRGYSLIGTTDQLSAEEPDAFNISNQEVRDFLAEVQRAYRSPLLREKDVFYCFGGLRPLDPDYTVPEDLGAASEEAKASRSDALLDHRHTALVEGMFVDNLISLRGIKYTTFRAFAEKAVDLLATRLRVKCASATKRTLLWGTPEAEVQKYSLELKKMFAGNVNGRIDYLIENYGSAAEKILAIEKADPALAQALARGCAVWRSEVAYSARQEKVETLSDVVLRRTPLGTTGFPGEEALQICGQTAAAQLGWSGEKVKGELAEMSRYFASRRPPR